MRFIRSENWDEGIAAIADRLGDDLVSGKRVLWLVSGGSQITANVRIMAQIPDDLSQNLTVTLVDERYGAPGHVDSNWTQLMDAGFPAKHAHLRPVLKEGLNFSQNTAYFNGLINEAFANSDVIIGQLGIGPDGHIAGILPHSVACQEVTALAIGYDAPPLQRMTITFPAFKKLDAAYVMAFGDSKRQSLTKLQHESLALDEQPAQILKDLVAVYIYNDQIGDAND